jgi:hypothetical protein
MRFAVALEGRGITAQARLLECLTQANLLSPNLTWEEVGDKIILHVENAPDGAMIPFIKKGFRTVEKSQPEKEPGSTPDPTSLKESK